MNTQPTRWTRVAQLLVLLVFTIFLTQARAQDAAKKIDELMTLYHDNALQRPRHC